jgi:hypothetical protein
MAGHFNEHISHTVDCGADDDFIVVAVIFWALSKQYRRMLIAPSKRIPPSRNRLA